MILSEDTEPKGDESPAERVCWLMGLLDRPRYDDLADRQLHIRQKWLDVIAGRAPDTRADLPPWKTPWPGEQGRTISVGEDGHGPGATPRA